MVPFQEYNRIDEHFYTFDYKSFPLKLNNFVLTYFKVIDSNPEYWPGKQLLVIYSKQESEIIKELSLEVYNPKENIELHEQDGYIEQLKSQIQERDEACNSLSQEINTLKKWVEVLQNEVDKRDKAVLALEGGMQGKDKWINTLKEEVSKRDEATLYLKKEIEEKDKWINILKEEVSKRDETTLYLKNEVEERDKRISTLQGQMQKRGK